MSLIVETGAGLADAESYISVADTDAYWADVGDSLWATLNETEKEQALRRAVRFMKAIYRTKWAGRRVLQTQALDWPRYNVLVEDLPVPSNTVPQEVRDACAELAIRAAAGPLLDDADTSSTQIKKDKVGALETEYFQPHVEPAERFLTIGAMLQPYFGGAGGSNSIKLVRG